MKDSLLGMLTFVVVFSLNAQDLHIHYDVFKDSISYSANGVPVQDPLVRKGDDIILHVTNYNDYLYDLEVNTAEENYAKPSAGLESLLLGGSGISGLTQLQSLLAPTLGAAGNIFQSGGFGDEEILGFGSDGTRQILTTEMKGLQAGFNNVLIDIAAIEEELLEINQSLQLEVERQQYNAFMETEVMNLKTNTNLPPTSIKSITMEYLNKILNIDQNGNFDLKDLFDQANVRKTFGRKLDNYSSEVEKMNSKFAELSTISQSIQALSFSDEFQSTVAAAVIGVQAETEQLSQNVSRFQQLLPSLETQSIESLSALRYLHEEMKNHRFEKKIIITPDSDITTLNITMKPLDSLSQRIAPKTLNAINVRSFGAVKVNASIGVSFASFFERPQNYFVREGLLYGDDLDAFLPVITSFVHFYQESKKQTSLGGTLGIGLGLGSETGGLQNYFLGTSLIMGKGQRIVLSTGLMGGRVTRLAQGLAVGDVFTDQLVPTKSIYELGLFLGVSFNVLGN